MPSKYALYRYVSQELDSIISKGFKEFNLDKKLKKSRLVMIKPNLVTDVREYIENGANTDTRIIEAVIKYISQFDTRIVVAESETGTKLKGRRLDLALEHMGVTALKDKYEFDIVNLTKDEQVPIVFKDGLILKNIYLGKTSIDADLIINIPKLKTHKYATITCALKNMFGCIPDPVRVIYHRNIHKTLADLNSLFINKTFIVLDGLVAMEGQGPLFGRPIHMNIIAFSDDMLVNDIVASRIMGFRPDAIKHIRYFKERYHNPPTGEIIMVGDLAINNVRKKFKPSKKNWFVRIEEQLMRNRLMVRILFSDFVRKNVTYRFRNVLKGWRGGSYSWYVGGAKQ